MIRQRSLTTTLALLVIFSSGCLSRVRGSRCKHDLDCEQGLVCSNERNRQNDGVCIQPCEPHIAVAACPSDAGSDARSDARSDSSAEAAVPDGATDVLVRDALDAQRAVDVVADTFVLDVPTDIPSPRIDIPVLPDVNTDSAATDALSDNPSNSDASDDSAEVGSDL